MKKFCIVALESFVLCLALLPGTEALARTYTTTFSFAENPISEGGQWINGKSAGLDWSDVQTTNGYAMGLQRGPFGYDDSTALLVGAWGPNQTVTAIVHTTNQRADIFEEVEVRLRSSLSAHSSTGYEVLFSLKNDSSAYVSIVRWNGSLSDFTTLDATGGPQFILHEGDEIKGTITNQTIAAFINGVKVMEVTDGTYSSGNPGMGFFLEGTTGVNGDYGFASLTASDGLEMQETQPPAVILNSPVAAATVSNRVSISANATDDVAVAGVQFRVDAMNLGAEVLTPPYTNFWNTVSVANGPHRVEAIARDLAGNRATNGVVVTVSNPPTEMQPPALTLTSPVAGATVSNSVLVSATATDNVGVVGVQFQIDGMNLGAEVLSPLYTVSWNTRAAANGLHSVRAIARDSAGNRATNGATVNVSNVFLPAFVAAYSLDEGAGAMVSDSSGNGNTGLISGAAWTMAGRYGNALSFSGTSWLTVNDSDSLDLTSGMTLEAWAYPTALSGNWITVLLKETSGNLVYMIACDPANHPTVYILTSSGLQGVTGPSSLPANVWSHLGATYDGSILRLFVNGNVVGSQSVSGAILTSTGPLRIGGNSVWGEYFDGIIDEIRVYNRALSQGEIQADMGSAIVDSFVLTIQKLADSSVQLHLDGNPSRTYAIQFTEHLDNPQWQTLGNMASDGSGGFNLVDLPPAGTLSRFYRAFRL